VSNFPLSAPFAETGVLMLVAVAIIVLLAAAVVLGAIARRRLATSEAEGRQELARLSERTARLASVETELSSLKERYQAASADLARTRATLDERDNEARRLDEDLGKERAALADLRSRTEDDAADLRETMASLQSKLSAVQADLRAKTEEAEGLKAEFNRAREQREEAQRLLGEARVALTDMSSRSTAERKAADEKLALLTEAKTLLTDQFKVLAADILEEKAKSFTEVNRASIGALLDPVKTQLADFKGKVEEVYINEAKERSALGEQVKQLFSLNQQLSKDAHNLTTALRGQAKSRGNWGELILERVLEAAGLVKGVHYSPQESHTRDDGSRLQPDIVLNLPGERFMVIDSKVSLNAYDDYVNGEEEAQKTAALRRHLDSLNGHIKDLASKNYQELHGLKSLDFVILFVPIEPAFLVAVDRDPDLWQAAWEKNILLVSPSQLMFVVRTVAQLWQKEQQSKNAQDIAKRGAALYDKLVGFVEDLDRVGKGLRTAQDAYDKAFGKFATGAGNVVRQAEMLRALGLKTTKRLEATLVENAVEPEDAAALPSPEDEAADQTP